jgi:hypothetical protein
MKREKVFNRGILELYTILAPWEPEVVFEQSPMALSYFLYIYIIPTIFSNGAFGMKNQK